MSKGKLMGKKKKSFTDQVIKRDCFNFLKIELLEYNDSKQLLGNRSYLFNTDKRENPFLVGSL